jgi:phosphoenolpyruvate---glycerone phosphotransferase subunit DhaL
VASPALLGALAAAATAVEGSAAELNRLDGFAGDGDLGITMTAAARALKEVLATGEDLAAGALLSTCGATLARVAPSTSGTLLATGFLRAAKAMAGDLDGIGAVQRAFDVALEGIQGRGKASVGDRTMVDGLHSVCLSLAQSAEDHVGLAPALRAAAEAAQVMAQATQDMVPKIGRASWVPDRAAGHPDAGCTMLAIALAAVATYMEAR